MVLGEADSRHIVKSMLAECRPVAFGRVGLIRKNGGACAPLLNDLGNNPVPRLCAAHSVPTLQNCYPSSVGEPAAGLIQDPVLIEPVQSVPDCNQVEFAGWRSKILRLGRYASECLSRRLRARASAPRQSSQHRDQRQRPRGNAARVKLQRAPFRIRGQGAHRFPLARGCDSEEPAVAAGDSVDRTPPC